MEAYDPRKIYHELMEAGEDWADKKAAYELLSDNTKSVLSKTKEKYSDVINLSDAAATTMALQSPDYTGHLRQVAEARGVYLLAQVKYDTMKTLSDHIRTQQSNIRQEMKHIGGM